MATQSQPSNKGYKSLNRIYNDPGTAFALDLFQLFSSRKLDQTALKTFWDSLPAEAASERSKIENLMGGKGSADSVADLTTRPQQLAWAAALGHVALTTRHVKSHPVWKALQKNNKVADSLGATARFIDRSITNRNATMDYGTPGSWFYFNPKENHVNIDLFHTLLLGFADDPVPGISGLAHAAGVMMHEVGHSQLSTQYPPKITALRDREEKLVKAAQKRKLTEEEYLDLVSVQTELQLRHHIWNAAEDNCVNRYAANHSTEFPHDFGYSLNVCNVLMQGSGQYIKDQEASKQTATADEALKKLLDKTSSSGKAKTASQAFTELSQAIALSFYTSNGLFDTNDKAGWKRVGIDPDKIQGDTPDYNFQKLMAMNIGPKGMASLQPHSRDRWLLRSIFNNAVDSYAEKRCEIVDQIWDHYAAPHAKILLEQALKEAKQKLEQKKKQNQQNKNQNGKKEQSNPSQGGESGGQQQGDQSGGQQSPGDGQSNGESQSQPGEGQSQGGGTPQPGEGGAPSSPPSPGEGESSGGGSVEVEGVGEMPIGPQSPSSPREEAEQKGQKGADKANEQNDSADNKDKEAPSSVRDLAEKAKEKERDARKKAEQNSEGAAKKGEQSDHQADKQKPLPDDLRIDNNSSGGNGRGVDMEKLAKGDWREYNKRINELSPIVSRVAKDFSYIRSRQIQRIRAISSQHEELPRSGDLQRRLDMRRHIDYAVKRATGQHLKAEDRKRWKKDQVTTEPTSVELWVLTDGSGSMKNSLPEGGRRIDTAVQTMAILQEAGKRADFNTFVGMWGDGNMRLLARPGDNNQKIGDRFQQVRDGINSGTRLSPSFAEAVQYSASHESRIKGRKSRFAGMTHFLIISDGELNRSDIAPTVNMINALFRYGPAVSVDIAVLAREGNCQMNEVVSRVKKSQPGAAIDIIYATSPKTAPVLLARKIKRRFEVSETRAVPESHKREAFGSAYRAIKSHGL